MTRVLVCGGLYVILRRAGRGRDARGFVIKPVSRMLFSERHGGYRHAFRIGPLYVRTYARRPVCGGRG